MEMGESVVEAFACFIGEKNSTAERTAAVY